MDTLSDQERAQRDAALLIQSIRKNECDEDELASYLANRAAAVRAAGVREGRDA